MNIVQTRISALCAVVVLGGCVAGEGARGDAVDAEETSSLAGPTAASEPAKEREALVRSAAVDETGTGDEDETDAADDADEADEADEAEEATDDVSSVEAGGDDSSSEESRATTDRVAVDSFDTEDVQNASGKCIASAIVCAFAATGFAATCVANIFSAGTLTPECVAALSSVGGACADTALVCGKSSRPTLFISQSPIIGAAAPANRSFSQACAGFNRANALRGRSGTLVDRIGVRCTNGALLSAGGTGGRGFVTTCKKGYLLRGVDARSGARVDAVRAVCARIGRPSSLMVGGWRGGRRGGAVQRRVLCPANRWVYGDSGTFSGTIVQLRLRCK